MLPELSAGRGVARPVSVSTVVHLLVIAAVLGYGYRHPAHIVNSAGRSAARRIELVYLPGKAPAPTLHPIAKSRPAAVAKLTPSAAPVLPAPLPQLAMTPAATPAAPTGNNPSPPSEASDPASDPTTGSNSWAAGDAEQIALTTYSPSPVPDLSVLPRGVQGDVIVDITIDTGGRISDLKVVKNLGYGIESTVVNTVRTWTFQPATKDGVPVASVQELLFHFGRPEASSP